MSLSVRDGTGAAKALKSSLDGTDHVPHQNVDTLPSAFTSDTGAIKAAVQALAAIISGGRFAVDLSATVITYLSNLPTLATYLNTLQGAITAARMQVDLATTPTANLATIAGAITASRMAVNVDSTTTGKLDTLHTDLAAIATNQGVPAGGPKFGYVGSIGTGSNTTFASKALTRGCVVTNLDTTNNLLISVGTPGATDVDTTTVKPGMSSPFIACSNANAFNMRSSASTVAATYSGA